MVWQAYEEIQSPKSKTQKNHSLSTINHKLVIIVARDATVKRIKGNAPRNSEQRRQARVIEELAYYPDVAVRLGRADADFWATIAEEMPDRILLGYDQKFDEDACVERFPDIKLERATAYAPEVFKSSKF